MHSTIRDINVKAGQEMLVNLQNKFVVTRQVIHPLAGAKSEPLSKCVECEILAKVNVRIAVLRNVVMQMRHQCFEGTSSVHLQGRITVVLLP